MAWMVLLPASRELESESLLDGVKAWVRGSQDTLQGRTGQYKGVSSISRPSQEDVSE